MPEIRPEVLFAPVTLGNLSLRNRVVMAPMSRYRTPSGIPGEAMAEYYRRRAAAGVGLIVSEGTYIDHRGAPVHTGVPHVFGAEALDGWRRVVAAVHEHGACMVPQLWHVGAMRELGNPPDPAIPGFGPCDIDRDGRRVVVAMSRLDIQEVADSFARGAYAARQIGFDGVAVHGGHGYLLDQFLWRATNRRWDEYGGSIVNLCHLAATVVRAIRASVGSDFPILFRFSQWKAHDYNARIADTPAELRLILGELVDAGVDIFDASTRRFWQPAFDENPETLAAITRRLTGRPVIAVGCVGLDQPHQSKHYRTADNVASNVTGIDAVHEGLARGDFDLAAVGRALLADPCWVEKVRRGAFDEVRPFTRESLDLYS